MLRNFLAAIFSVVFVMNANAAKPQENEVPRTVYKDIYKYYILEANKNATNFEVTYKRASFDSISYGKVQVNCAARYIKEVGASVRSPKEIAANPNAQWYQPAIGTIQFDMINYVCR